MIPGVLHHKELVERRLGPPESRNRVWGLCPPQTSTLPLDSRGSRHGATINETFRLMSVPGDAFVNVEGEERLTEIPDRNRVFLDEDAANELASADVPIRQVGVCRLKGFSGFHRVYELLWSEP